MVSCPEEIAYYMGYIDAGRLAQQAAALRGTEYGRYLLSILDHRPLS